MTRESFGPDVPEFHAYNRFPDASSLFAVGPRSISEIADECLVVLDTNALLSLYDAKATASLGDCDHIYGDLADAGRLVIPGQVAREFADRRGSKINELHHNVVASTINSPKSPSYPLLATFEESAELARVSKATAAAIATWNKTVDRMALRIAGWHWNDPVSLMYRRHFVDLSIFDLVLDREQLLGERDKRYAAKIPPGYEDQKKPDRGIGDLLIWQVILELGRTRKQDLLLVSHDQKKDWWHQSEGKPLYPRFELIEEYWRVSNGKTFQIASLAELLRLYGAKEQTVDDIREAEERSANQPTIWVDVGAHASDVQIIRGWIAFTNPNCIIESGVTPFDLVYETHGKRVGVSVIRFVYPHDDWARGLDGFLERLTAQQSHTSPLPRVVVIVDSPFAAKDAVALCEAKVRSAPTVSLAIGHVWQDGFIPLRDIVGAAWAPQS